jgi:cephalosporin-C deacetylase-like acetyl esterase
MQKVCASLVCAVDYLVTRPEWDGKNILVQGNSQGGGLGLALAALDPRVTALAIAHPALSDMAAYAEKGRTGGYPHFSLKYEDITLTPEVIRTLQYYDAVNFARLVKCPTYMTWGYNDNVCPPTTSYAVWNTLTCEKECYITPINEHWTSDETRYRQMRFLLKHCR